jgi:integrase
MFSRPGPRAATHLVSTRRRQNGLICARAIELLNRDRPQIFGDLVALITLQLSLKAKCPDSRFGGRSRRPCKPMRPSASLCATGGALLSADPVDVRAVRPDLRTAGGDRRVALTSAERWLGGRSLASAAPLRVILRSRGPRSTRGPGSRNLPGWVGWPVGRVVATGEETAALLEAARRLRPALRAARHQTLIGLQAVTGCRPGELLARDRQDVELTHGRIHVRSGKQPGSRCTRARSARFAATPSSATLPARARQHPAFFLSARGSGWAEKN